MNDKPAENSIGAGDSEPQPRKSGRGHGAMTVSEVAQLAGVSTMTVSRALNSPGKVSPKNLAKVQAAIRQTGYVANRLASGLATSRSRLVAAVFPSIGGLVFQETLQSLTLALAASKYQLILGQSGYGVQQEDELLDAIIGRRPDGVVLCGAVPSSEGRQRLVSSGLAVVETWDLVANPIDMVVGFSHEALAAGVASYLLKKGRRRLAFVGGNHTRGYRRGQAFISAALNPSTGAQATRAVMDLVPAPGTVGTGRQALRRILEQQPDTDAIFCSSDMMALGAVTEAQALGISIPRQLAVIGFGDYVFSPDVRPALSSVRVDGTAMGQLAARYLVEKTEGRNPGDRYIDVGFSIVERETS